MICKQCPGNTLAYPLTKEFEVDLEVAQTAFAKLMDMPLKQLNKSQWYDEFSNRMMFQPIIGLFKQYECSIPHSASSHKRACQKHITQFLGYTKKPSKPRRRMLSYLSQYITKEGNITLCPCALIAQKTDHAVQLQTTLQHKLDNILDNRRVADQNLLSLTVEVNYVHSKRDYRYTLSAEFLEARNKVEKRIAETSTKLLKYAKNIQAVSYDLEDMNTPQKIKTFKASVKKELQRFSDAAHVTDIKVYTSDYVPEYQRPDFKNYFKQKDKYIIDIVIADYFIARTTLSSLRKRQDGGKVCDMISSDAKIINDLYRISNKFKLYPIWSVQVERGEKEGTGKQRIHAHITYTNGETDYVRNFSNYPGVDQPTLLLPTTDKKIKSVPTYGSFSYTHIIFYVWSGIIQTEGTREVIYKFGISRFDWADKQTYTVDECVQSVMNRQLNYCRSHNLVANEINIELISTPIPFSGNWGDSALGQLEYWLKKPENNPLLIRNDMSDDYNVTSTNSTEFMCDDRLRQLFVIPFIKNYINTMESEQPITFIDLDNGECGSYTVPRGNDD
ncbi:hypothetical protein [Pseudoalteromonas sp. 120-MNA-CIBAN-0494]|uniref:hypothetical protein n=2 Tax=Pseudoalteromonas TaxID=53246 RepID=UPI003319D32D